MADVTRPPDEGRVAVQSSDDARGQLLLTASVVIAMLFVTLALLLNSAVFTENLGARTGGDDAVHSAIQYHDDLRTVTNETVARVNARENATYANRWHTVADVVGNWSTLTGRHEAVTGGVLNASLRTTTNGTWIRQTASSRNFSDATGATNWTLVTDAPAVREFSLTVDLDSLVEPDATESPANFTNESAFSVVVSNDTQTWRVFVVRNDSDLSVTVESPPGTLQSPCRVPAGGVSTVDIDFLEATVGGDHCESLAFLAPFEGPWTLEYRHGANASGTYTLITDRQYTFVDGFEYGEDPDAGPTVRRVLTAAEVRLTAVTPTLTYRSDIAVTWGGHDG